MEEEKGKSISRREFIKTSTFGTVGTVVLSQVPLAFGADPPNDEEDGGQYATELDITINGRHHHFRIDPRTTLAELLRNRLNLTGTKVTCNHGQCGTCTVLLDDRAVYSCHMLALDANGKKVTTIEGLLSGEELHPVQQAFVEKDGLQCGFCTSGQVMAAYAVLKRYPAATKEQILRGMSGNLCRCAAYPKILDSVMEAAK